MKQFLKQHLIGIGIGVEVILIAYVAFVTVIFGDNHQEPAFWYSVTKAIANALIPFIPFYLGVKAHGKQTDQLADIRNILDQENVKITNTVSKIANENIMPYVHVALYAMSQAHDNHPFDYRLIDPKNETIYKFLILAISSALSSDHFVVYIDKDDYLCADVFANNTIQSITKGNELISKYTDSGSEKMIKECVNRINGACGITQND